MTVTAEVQAVADDECAPLKVDELMEQLSQHERSLMDLRRLLHSCGSRLSSLEGNNLSTPHRHRPTAFAAIASHAPPAPSLRTVLIGPTGPRPNPFQEILQARMLCRNGGASGGGATYLLGHKLPTRMPAANLEVESDQSDVSVLMEGLDPVFEVPELHWQAVTRNTVGQGPGESKRVLLRTSSSVGGGSPTRAVDPTLSCMKHIFGLGFDVACMKGICMDDLWNPSGWSVTQTSLTSDGSQRCTILCACAGHGPLAHILSSRVSQSLPALTLQQLRIRPEDLPGPDLSDVLQRAFQAAESDITCMAAAHNIDLGHSCTAAALVIHVPPDSVLHCAWVGDVQLAVIDEGPASISVMQLDGHLVVGEEARRVEEIGAELVAGPDESTPPRLALHGLGPCPSWSTSLPCTRALGAGWGAPLGVIWMPEYAKLEASPGANVLLTAGGICGALSVEDMYELKGSDPGAPLLSMPGWADRICLEGQRRRQVSGVELESSTCLVWSLPMDQEANGDLGEAGPDSELQNVDVADVRGPP